MSSVEALGKLVRAQQQDIDEMRDQIRALGRQMDQLNTSVKLATLSARASATPRRELITTPDSNPGCSSLTIGPFPIAHMVKGLYELLDIDPASVLLPPAPEKVQVVGTPKRRGPESVAEEEGKPSTGFPSPIARCEFLHRLPCFHSVWKELCSLSNQVHAFAALQHSPSSLGDATSPTKAVLLASSASHLQCGAHIPILEVDVGPTFDDRLQGAMVQRISSGSPLQRAGISVGDTIIAINGQPMPDPYSLQVAARDANDEARRRGTPLQIDVIPVGRHRAMPLVVSLHPTYQ